MTQFENYTGDIVIEKVDGNKAVMKLPDDDGWHDSYSLDELRAIVEYDDLDSYGEVKTSKFDIPRDIDPEALAEALDGLFDDFTLDEDERPRIGDVYEHLSGVVAYLGEYDGSKVWLDLDGKQSGHKAGGSPDSYVKLPDFEHEDVFVFPQSGGIHDSGDPVRRIPLDISITPDDGNKEAEVSAAGLHEELEELFGDDVGNLRTGHSKDETDEVHWLDGESGTFEVNAQDLQDFIELVNEHELSAGHEGAPDALNVGRGRSE